MKPLLVFLGSTLSIVGGAALIGAAISPGWATRLAVGTIGCLCMLYGYSGLMILNGAAETKAKKARING